MPSPQTDAEDHASLPRSAYRWIKELMRDAEIHGLQASPKGLRHGFASWAILSGVPVTMVQKWLGHASLETTMIYTTLAGPEETSLAERMWAAGQIESNDKLVEMIVRRVLECISKHQIYGSDGGDVIV